MNGTDCLPPPLHSYCIDSGIDIGGIILARMRTRNLSSGGSPVVDCEGSGLWTARLQRPGARRDRRVGDGQQLMSSDVSRRGLEAWLKGYHGFDVLRK